MSEQRKQILQMLAEGKIGADEAERLLAALESKTDSDPDEDVDEQAADTKRKKKPTFLHITVQGGGRGKKHKHEMVDIKVPIMLLKAGVKLGSLVPESCCGSIDSHLSDHGLDLDLNNLDSEKLDVLLQALSESSIDIMSDDEMINIRCA
jgi:hypothetical protein